MNAAAEAKVQRSRREATDQRHFIINYLMDPKMKLMAKLIIKVLRCEEYNVGKSFKPYLM